MGSNEEASGITREEMAAREEADLRLPGSRLVHEEGSDEGEGWGFDHALKSAMLRRVWSTDALADEIVNWYRGQLASRGWTLTNSHAQTADHPIGSDFCAALSARLTNHRTRLKICWRSPKSRPSVRVTSPSSCWRRAVSSSP